ncbi:CHASE2 domain-containing protein [Iningainema tapete]|uniref:CHASE2 domain-containing protein n=1 Tax=Iningainema tapete BLCC-T55 TaxID=2748662 RepID=A0A8J7CDM3_9CYAN|nr:CHASE2 domain-containing protein [Iningainema tapete]MBD2772935.1 CHASE2 domain-containing protein [Iningainema tapete BLCC-T55]
MHRLVVLNLGKGDLQQGFPTVTAQFWESEELTPMQFTGSLPAIPSLDGIYQRWQLLYEALYNNLAWRKSTAHPEFEIDEEDDEISHVSYSEFQEVSQNLQTQLNCWLSSHSFLAIERKLRTYLTPKDEFRLIIVTQDGKTLKLPWCLWDFLSDYPKVEISLSPPEYTRSLKENKKRVKKIKILSILGNSSGIDINQDRQILQQLPDSDITFLIEPKSSELNEQLWKSEWDILFFAGHSSSQGKGCIQINAEESLTIEQLKYALKKAISHGLKLAIFNSCDGLGLARDLADLHLPQVIVMREPIPDKVAQEFLKHFLASFATGKSLYLSVREAREKLQGLEAEFPCATWLPVICQNPAEIPFTWQDLYEQKNPLKLLPNRQQLRSILLCSLVNTLLVAGIRFLGLLSPIELSAFDMLMRSRIHEKPDDRLLIVTVTSEDIQSQDLEPRFGSLSDTTLSKLLQKLEKHQPLAIGLDIYRDYPSRKPELALQLRQSKSLIGICKRPDIKDDPTGTLPSPEIPQTQLGFSDFVQDYDGAVRRHLLFMTPSTTSRCTAAYALSTQLAFRYLQAKNILPEFTPEANLKLGKNIFPSIGNRTGGYQSVDAAGSQVLLNYRAMTDPQMVAQRVTLRDILDDKVNPLAIQNRIILIGIVDKSAGDYWATPYGAGSSNKLPGVLVHAHMVSQILSHVLDKRPLLWVLSGEKEFAWIACWAVLGGFIAWRFSRLKIIGTVVIISVIILYGSCWLLVNSGGWIPLVPSAISLLLTNGTVVILLLRQNQLEQIK